MTPSEWLAEVCRRIGINEGRRRVTYDDTVGVKTIGIGFNLERPDARMALAKVGADYDAVMRGTPLTDAQVDALFGYSFRPIESEARASLAAGVYDALSDARRFVVCDLVFNLGAAGWAGFTTTRGLIDRAQAAKTAGDLGNAHTLFVAVGDHLAASAYAAQVGDRARRNAAMLRAGAWCDPYGNGSDI